MPITFSVDHRRGFVSTLAEGPITFGDVLRHLQDERMQGGLPFPELIDGRGYVPDFSSDQVRSIVEWLRSAGKASALGPTAVVVGSEVGYGMVRMVGLLVDDICEVRPFRSTTEAEAWLATTRHPS